MRHTESWVEWVEPDNCSSLNRRWLAFARHARAFKRFAKLAVRCGDFVVSVFIKSCVFLILIPIHVFFAIKDKQKEKNMKKMVLAVAVFGFLASFTRALWEPVQMVADATGKTVSDTVSWLNG